jgi:acyl carrier protein
MTSVEQSTWLREGLRDFVQDNFMYLRPEEVLRDDDDLLALGILDSMGLVELVEQVQDRSGLVVQDRDITEANFASVDAIVRYVAGRRGR